MKPRAIPLCAAASVYHGCRIAGYPRTVEEIGTVIGINGKDINRMQGYLLRELNLSHGRITASNLVNRFSSLLGLPYSVVQQIQELCSSINSYELLDGKSPQTCAAVAILIVCFCTSRVINLDNLCSISLTSRSGIEQTYNKLYQHLSLLLLSQNIKKVIVGAAVTANKELKIVENRNCSNTNGCESSIPSTDDVPDIPAGIKIGNLQDFLPKSLSMALVEGTSYTMRLRNFILKNLAKSRIKKLLKLSLEAVNSESSGTSASRTSIVSKANSGAIAEAKSLNSVDDVSEISGTKRNIDSYEAIPEATLKKQRVL